MTNDEKRLCNIVLIQLSFDIKWAHFDTFSDDISQNNMQHDWHFRKNMENFHLKLRKILGNDSNH